MEALPPPPAFTPPKPAFLVAPSQVILTQPTPDTEHGEESTAETVVQGKQRPQKLVETTSRLLLEQELAEERRCVSVVIWLILAPFART